MDDADRKTGAAILESAIEDYRNHFGKGPVIDPTMACFIEFRIAQATSWIKDAKRMNIADPSWLDLH